MNHNASSFEFFFYLVRNCTIFKWNLDECLFRRINCLLDSNRYFTSFPKTKTNSSCSIADYYSCTKSELSTTACYLCNTRNLEKDLFKFFFDWFKTTFSTTSIITTTRSFSISTVISWRS